MVNMLFTHTTPDTAIIVNLTARFINLVDLTSRLIYYNYTKHVNF